MRLIGNECCVWLVLTDQFWRWSPVSDDNNLLFLPQSMQHLWLHLSHGKLLSRFTQKGGTGTFLHTLSLGCLHSSISAKALQSGVTYKCPFSFMECGHSRLRVLGGGKGQRRNYRGFGLNMLPEVHMLEPRTFKGAREVVLVVILMPSS